MKPQDRHGKVLKLEGQKFGRLTVIEYVKTSSQYNVKEKSCEMKSLSVWKCECECGKTVERTSKQLRLRIGLWCDDCKKIYAKSSQPKIVDLGIKFSKGTLV